MIENFGGTHAGANRCSQFFFFIFQQDVGKPKHTLSSYPVSLCGWDFYNTVNPQPRQASQKLYADSQDVAQCFRTNRTYRQ